MKVLCTGMSGTGRTSYVRAVADLARQNGNDLRVYDVRDVMFELARSRGEALEEETILDVFPTALGAYRAAALERINAEVKALPADTSWIIVTHATFSWNYTIVPGLDVYYLNLLQPDMYVTITDGILSIRQRLTEERWRRVTINNLLWWRDVERAATEMMADWQRKPHYLLGRRQGPETLYRLMFEPDVRTTYLAYPMTHIEDEETLKGLERFRQQLSERLVVFNPASVDDFTLELDGPVGFSDGSVEARQFGSTMVSSKLEGAAGFSGVGSIASKQGQARDIVLDAREAQEGEPARPANPENLDHIDGQIVDRDYKLIRQSQMVCVYYPTTLLSAGVICEMNDAIHRGKRVYALWLPDKPPSPFFTRYCTKWFRDERAYFAYLDQHVFNRTPARAAQPGTSRSNGRANGTTRPRAKAEA